MWLKLNFFNRIIVLGFTIHIALLITTDVLSDSFFMFDFKFKMIAPFVQQIWPVT